MISAAALARGCAAARLPRRDDIPAYYQPYG